MQTNLAGKTVLVTEAVRNYGRATAMAFAREGANLLLATSDRNDLLEETAHEAAESGVKVVTALADVGDETQVKELVAKGRSELGNLDVLVNNCHFSMAQLPLEEIPFERWRQKMQVEITGALLVCQEVLPGMIAQQWGRVISYTGLHGFRGTDTAAATTELGIVGLTRGIAREYGKYNITANCVAPGGISETKDSEILSQPPEGGDPLTRWGHPEEVAFLAVCLASEDAGYITGQSLLASGGRYFL